MNKCRIGGIIKHNDKGVGFKVTFTNPDHAVKYKDMFYWIIKNDKVKVDIEKGYYDAIIY